MCNFLRSESVPGGQRLCPGATASPTSQRPPLNSQCPLGSGGLITAFPAPQSASDCPPPSGTATASDPGVNLNYTQADAKGGRGPPCRLGGACERTEACPPQLELHCDPRCLGCRQGQRSPHFTQGSGPDTRTSPKQLCPVTCPDSALKTVAVLSPRPAPVRGDVLPGESM